MVRLSNFHLFQNLLQFIHKGIDIFKFSVYRSKTHIGNCFQVFEFIHHDLSDHRTRNLPFLQIEDLGFHLVHQLVDLLCRYRTFVAGTQYTRLNL